MTIAAIAERADLLDAGALDFEECPLIGLCNLYLFASYAYYERNVPILGDTTFDRLCKFLYDNWDFLEASGVWHVGKVIVEDNLRSGTCLGIEYPAAVVEIAEELIATKRARQNLETLAPAQHKTLEEEYDI